jgi:penicillin-binding protein 2
VTGSDVSTSWYTSYAPADNPRYAVVMMVTEGGTGGKTSGPSVRKIYEALFGVTGNRVNPADSILISGEPLTQLPAVNPDGTVVGPKGRVSGVATGRS